MASSDFWNEKNWVIRPISQCLKTLEISFHQVGEFLIFPKANSLKEKSSVKTSIWKKLFQCAFWRSHSVEYLASYFIEKVQQRLKNISENPNIDDVLNNTVVKGGLSDFIEEYHEFSSYGLKTISNTLSWWTQIFKVFKP